MIARPPPAPQNLQREANMRKTSLESMHSETNIDNMSRKNSRGETLEQYRENAKKSSDPAYQFQFAKHLISIAQELKPDAENGPKIIRKRQELLSQEAIRWIKKLTTQGKSAYPEAQFFLAECYGSGTLGLSVDHDKAFSLYLQASKQAHPSSTYRTAVCYEIGAGTKRDLQKALQFYRKAAALGDTAGMYKLGMILLNGTLNQTKNPREAVTWLKRAASQADEDNPHALHELAVLYEGKNEDVGNSIIPVYFYYLLTSGSLICV
jgi:TPR repeat protein